MSAVVAIATPNFDVLDACARRLAMTRYPSAGHTAIAKVTFWDQSILYPGAGSGVDI